MRLADTPAYLNFPGEAGHVRYGEGRHVGYRYYDAVDRKVSYPFGHGLSYTSFEHSPSGSTTRPATISSLTSCAEAPEAISRRCSTTPSNCECSDRSPCPGWPPWSAWRPMRACWQW